MSAACSCTTSGSAAGVAGGSAAKVRGGQTATQINAAAVSFAAVRRIGSFGNCSVGTAARRALYLLRILFRSVLHALFPRAPPAPDTDDRPAAHPDHRGPA